MTIATRAGVQDRAPTVEWVTFLLITGCYGTWMGALFWAAAPLGALIIPVVAFAAVLHSSLTHEALHGHPFRSRFWNEAVMFLPLSLTVPYARFRDLHLAHHRDSNLTDPYDDPESNYLDPVVWARLPMWQRGLLRVNNTLAGRILIGPAIGQVVFMVSELRLIRAGEPGVLRAWVAHLIGVALVLALVWLSPMPLWAYLVACYIALGVLRIRTFLEHQAHEKVRGRTVIIEDRGVLAFLFLNNNLHMVHHMHPGVPWYRLPAVYRAGRARFLAINKGYTYRSYGEVFRRFFLRAKDPVVHPLWRGPGK